MNASRIASKIVALLTCGYCEETCTQDDRVQNILRDAIGQASDTGEEFTIVAAALLNEMHRNVWTTGDENPVLGWEFRSVKITRNGDTYGGGFHRSCADAARAKSNKAEADDAAKILAALFSGK